MKDFEGHELKTGDKFLYQFGEPHQCEGEIFDCGGVEVIKWDNDKIIAVADFYHQPTDQKILKKI